MKTAYNVDVTYREHVFVLLEVLLKLLESEVSITARIETYLKEVSQELETKRQYIGTLRMGGEVIRHDQTRCGIQSSRRDNRQKEGDKKEAEWFEWNERATQQ